jgi:hypothetical protein|tara:strand:- start:3877 stop:4092 length:216 start_codon:yes stop_codon:yes gene_type:complete
MPAWITPEFLDETPSPALDSLSSTTTDMPIPLQDLAIDKPTTPAPITTRSKIINLLYKKKIREIYTSLIII